MKNGNVVIIVSLIIVAAVIALTVLFMKQPKSSQKSIPVNSQSGKEVRENSNCDFGPQTYDDYLTTHKVKPGETLSSIAQQELGDKNLWKELAKLNYGKYQTISENVKKYPIEAPENANFLEVGWELHLPFEEIPQGDISIINGELIKMTPDQVLIRYYRSRKRSEPSSFPLNSKNPPKLLGKDNFSPLDCITIINNQYSQVIAVATQKYFPKKGQPTSIPVNIPALAQPVGNCQYKNGSSYDDFLTSYKIQSGDTLLSISQNQLGTTSRVQELIDLNYNIWPYLSINSILRPGKVLYLPPKNIITLGGSDLTVVKGELIKIEEDSWYAQIYKSSPVNVYSPTKDLVILGNLDLLRERCVSILLDHQKIRAISPQDRNYFND